MIKFYFDNYNILTSQNYNGKAILIDNTTEHGLVFFNNSCKLPININLRQKYYVRIDCTDELYQVEYRFIVHTERFEKEYSYDGKLGSFYYGDYSEFYVWAPTALNINICFTDNTIYPMSYTNQGVYFAKVEKDVEGIGYLLEVEHLTKEKSLDPYATSSTINSQYNYVVNPKKIIKRKPFLNISKRDAIIYEAHIRDFTTDPNCNFTYPGKYKGFVETGVRTNQGKLAGYDYIKNLGITHIQLLPIYDFGSIDEQNNSRGYNWGYDPVQYNVPEGKYSCNPTNPYERINEVIELVNTCKDDNIGIIMDVVYNHVYHKSAFSFEKLVPHYFFRYQHGEASNASWCGNEVASERYMVRKFIVDSLIYLTDTFGFAGYRFDLMGILDITTMQEIEKALIKINSNIYLYGEGWKMPTAISSDDCAIQPNFDKIPNIGFFNDDFRNKCKQLIVGHITSNKEKTIIKLLTAPNYNNPLQSIAYVSCHDNYTLFDELYYGFEEDKEEIIYQMKLAYIFILLGQGIPFLHGGCEGARTKYGVENSYNSSEEINRIKYDELNYELINFVKALIQKRKQLKCFLFNTAQEIQDNICIKIVDDTIIVYNIDKQPIITISLAQDKNKLLII
ncbi:type I pullulanase [Candidatus Epulonipiscioides gigas]|nr:type I pullulanase [Epulopiscium sp. SCG-C07WGA-EpuloA2]